MSTPILPLDVLGVIIDKVAEDSLESMKACAFLTHDLLPQVQRYIFSRIVLSKNTQCRQLSSILQTSPHIGTYTACVVISITGVGHPSGLVAIDDLDALSSVLSFFMNLRTLEIKSSMAIFVMLPAIFQETVSAFLRTLHTFSCTGITGIPLAALTSSPHLKRLNLRHFYPHLPSSMSCIATTPLDYAWRLETLEIDCLHCMRNIIPIQTANRLVHPLKNLTLVFWTRSFVQDALLRTHTTLETLYLAIGTASPSWRVEVEFTPIHLPRLRSLIYDGIEEHLHEFLTLSACLLEHNPAPISLESFSITIFHQRHEDIHDFFAPSNVWDRIDAVLSDPKFVQLKVVSVRLIWNAPNLHMEGAWASEDAVRQWASERLPRSRARLIVTLAK